jgi:hypothetical protein
MSNKFQKIIIQDNVMMEERMAKGVRLGRNSYQVNYFLFRSMAGDGFVLFVGGNPETVVRRSIASS